MKRTKKLNEDMIPSTKRYSREVGTVANNVKHRLN